MRARPADINPRQVNERHLSLPKRIRCSVPPPDTMLFILWFGVISSEKIYSPKHPRSTTLLRPFNLKGCQEEAISQLGLDGPVRDFGGLLGATHGIHLLG